MDQLEGPERGLRGTVRTPQKQIGGSAANCKGGRGGGKKMEEEMVKIGIFGLDY